MKPKWPQVYGKFVFITIVIIIIVLTQIHLIIAAPTSATRAPADDVTDHVTSSWSRGSGSSVTERRHTVPSNWKRVVSNAAAPVPKTRGRRQVMASQGCGPVCNRCRQVRIIVLCGSCFTLLSSVRLSVCPSVCMSSTLS